MCDRFESAFVSTALSIVRDRQRGVNRLHTTIQTCRLQTIDPFLFISHNRKCCTVTCNAKRWQYSGPYTKLSSKLDKRPTRHEIRMMLYDYELIIVLEVL